jgi:hypothetical protein
MTQPQENNKFKLITFASNKDGTKIYCRLAHNKKTLIKGYYDFNKEQFIITDYVKQNFIQGIGKNTAKKKLQELLEQDYDWNL